MPTFLINILSPFAEPARQNNGKATILVDSSRILRDLLAQVESLRKENAALLTESSYVSFSNLALFSLHLRIMLFNGSIGFYLKPKIII